ncbi:hypothetical protein FACS189472_10830 [Alphaproteobacteria bacterium]|nr:hypothetical protein FACS189472_10830 [Alphaproteobacteria bacterium]
MLFVYLVEECCVLRIYVKYAVCCTSLTLSPILSLPPLQTREQNVSQNKVRENAEKMQKRRTLLRTLEETAVVTDLAGRWRTR